MPKVFRVTIEKSMTLHFVAESKDELEGALADADFDEWDGAEWDYTVIDLFNPRRPDMIPDEIPELEMAVNDGEAVSIDDYVPDNPDYLAMLKAGLEAAKAAAARLKAEKKAEPGGK